MRCLGWPFTWAVRFEDCKGHLCCPPEVRPQGPLGSKRKPLIWSSLALVGVSSSTPLSGHIGAVTQRPVVLQTLHRALQNKLLCCLCRLLTMSPQDHRGTAVLSGVFRDRITTPELTTHCICRLCSLLRSRAWSSACRCSPYFPSPTHSLPSPSAPHSTRLRPLASPHT